MSFARLRVAMGMSCDILDESGIPTACFLHRLDALLASCFLPFVVFRVCRHRKAQSQAETLSILAASCRTLALLLSLLITCLLLLPGSIISVPFIGTMIAISGLHYTELEVYPYRVASTELLLWWSTQIFVLSFWALSRPSVTNFIVAFLAVVVLILETCSSPWSPSGFEDASIFGKVNASFLDNMIRTAQQEPLTEATFAGRPNCLNTHEAYEQFESTFTSLGRHRKHRVIWTLLLFSKWRFAFLLIVNIVADLVSYTQPLLLALFLTSLKNVSAASVYLAIGLGAARLAINSLAGLRQLTSRSIFITSRAALMEVIYRKSLTIDRDSRSRFDAAKIMNLLNVDTQMVQNTYSKISSLISAPLGLVLCTLQLYLFLGKSTLAAIPLYMLYVPYSSWNTRQRMKKLPESMAAKDRRAKSTLNVMRNMKSLKLYAWEEPFAAHVIQDRQTELKIQRKFLKLSIVFSAITSQLDNLVATAVLIAFLYFSGEPLTSEIVFPTLSMISLVSDPLFALPSTLNTLGRAFTSQQRILEFLNEPDESYDNFYRRPGPGKNDYNTPLVEALKARITWEKQTDAPVAVNSLNLSLRRGDLCCVVGKVGAGKSALLKALCGQMAIQGGNITIRGSMAYASQEPWLQFQTLRENILFGLEYDQGFYQKTIRACDLESDIALFHDGDLTEIGEKGISLSGGQKARVALARAVYSRADVVILDDVLSAVDQHVAKKLLQELFAPGGLLANRTVVLATHSLHALKFSSQLVCLAKGGNVVFNGNPSEADFVALESAVGGSVSLDAVKAYLPSAEFDRRALVRHQYNPEEGDFDRKQSSTSPNSHFIPENSLKKDEHVDVPVIHTSRRYMDIAGRGVTLIAMVGLIGGVISSNLIPIWLAIWSDKGLIGVSASEYYVNVFLCIVVCAAVLSAVSSYLFIGTMALRASQRLHDEMLENVIRAPMAFFERTPLGAIMNRFTGDINTLDTSFPSTIYGFFRVTCTTFANLLIACVGSPFIIVALVPLLFRYLQYRRLYVPTRRQIQKLSSAANGPILSHIEESVRGVTTITVFGIQNQFLKGYERRSNYWMHVSFLQWALQRWLNCRVVTITALLTAVSALSIVFLVRVANMPVGVAGVVLYTVRLGVSRLTGIMSSWTSIEVNVVGVERVFGYIDQATEAPFHLPSSMPSVNAEWPSHGEITFHEYSTRFRPELPDVLHNISLSIKQNEKVGVVGRTGAGKSTLTVAIFRLLEASGGHIEIDDVNTAKLGLYDLRSRLAIIPQDAQIFKGTLRENLDPLGLVDDARLWHVLELCHLKTHFEHGLDMEIDEGGSNISRGQAQLICLGRALLRPTSVLVLDEATASVDNNTDSLVQNTIRSEFNDRTIITIAHRLETVMDSDRILVLDKGSVVEFDTPAKLLENKGALWQLSQSHEAM